jgi:hypothetical protein
MWQRSAIDAGLAVRGSVSKPSSGPAQSIMTWGA